jgi:hypothetical protein
MTKITDRHDLRTWVEEQLSALDGAEVPESRQDSAIESATDVLAARARAAGLLYGRDWSVWLAERGETVLIDHLAATANAE